MRRFGFAIVLAAAALGFFLVFQMGYGNRVYLDLVFSFEQQMARFRGYIDYFVLGSMVYLFGGIAAKITKTGSVYVVTAASIIIFFVFGRQMVIGTVDVRHFISAGLRIMAVVVLFWRFCGLRFVDFRCEAMELRC